MARYARRRTAAVRRGVLRACDRRRRTRRGRARGVGPIARLALGAVRVALALAILGFVPGLLDPFVAPKAAILRVIGLGLLVAVIVEALECRIRSGRAASPLGTGDSRIPGGHAALAMDLAVVAWVVAGVLSTAASVSPRLSLLGEIEQREGLLTTLALAGLYAGARRSHRESTHLRRTLDVVLVCAALTAAYALIQFIGLDPLSWAGVARYPAGAGSLLRPFGTLGNPILLGALLAPMLGIGVARLASGRGDAWRLAPLVMLFATALMATLSRGAWLAAAVVVGTALAGALLLGAPRAGRRAGFALAVAAIPTVLLGAFRLRVPLLARMSEGAQADALSAPARVEIARSALALWRDHPWLGSGPDTFGLMFPGVQTAAFWRRMWLGMPVHAHSAALQILATGGVVSVLVGFAWLAAIATAGVAAWRARGEQRGNALQILAAFAGLGVAGAVYPVGIAGAALFVVLAALLVHAHGDLHRAGSSSGCVPWAGCLVGLAMAVGLAIAASREMSALAAAGGARDALDQVILVSDTPRSFLLDQAVRRATEAASRAPREDELWRLCCDANLARARDAHTHRDFATAAAAASSAEAAARRAVGLEPHRAANLQRLGNALALKARVAPGGGLAGDGGTSATWRGGPIADRVDSVFAEARSRAPVDALILVDQARAQLELHQPERALAAAERIVALYPEAATGHALEAAAHMMLGQRDETRAALRRALAARWEDGAESERGAAETLLRALDAAVSAR